MGRAPSKKASLAILVSLLLAGCSSSPEEPIPLGFLSSFTGATLDYGASQLLGAELAVAEINNRGGIRLDGRRRPLVLFIEDTAASPEMALEKALLLINQHRVAALVGPFISQTAVPATRIAEQARVPMICPAASHPEVTRGKEFVFRLALTDGAQGRVLASFARSSLGAERIAVLYDRTNSHSREVTSVFVEESERLGVEVRSEPYIAGDTDWRPQMQSFAAFGAQVLFLPNPGRDATRQAEQARSLGLEATFLGSDSWNVKEMSQDPKLDQAYVFGLWHPENERPESQEFLASFRTLHGEEPATGAALAYDAVRLIVDAIEATDSLDGPTLQRQLARTEAFPGTVGPVTFGASGEPSWPALMLRFSGGNVEVVSSIRDGEAP